MSKKSNAQDGLSTLPETLRDPKFEGLRNLLLQCGKFGPKFDLPFQEIVKYFEGMKEKVRGEYEPFCLEWYRFLKKSCNDHFYETAPACYPKGRTTQDAYLAVKIAIVACCSEKEIKRVLKESGASFIDEEVEPILRSRRPVWLSKFLVWIAQAPDLMDVSANDYWQIYRRFLKEKIIPPMNDEVWFKLMIECMTFETCNDISSVPISLYDQLKDDPGLIETDIWRLFEFETFPKSWNFTTWDSIFHNYFNEKRKGEDWKGTLCTLIEEGTIPKKRVVDGCFKSLGRPFTDHESKWYVGLLELLIKRGIVTVKEQADDTRFLALLDNPNPTPRNLGLKISERLFKSGRLDDTLAIQYLTSILREPSKGKAKKGIVLLDKIAKQNPALRDKISLLLLEGLHHESVDIQQASLKILDRYDALKDADVIDPVARIRELLAPSVRKLLPSLEGKTEENEKAEIVPIPVAEDVRLEKMTPVQSFDELLELAAKLLERPEDINDIERLFDGLARIGSNRGPDFEKRTAPLLKRAMKLLRANTRIVDGTKVTLLNDYEPFAGQDIHADLKYLIIAWLTGMVPRIKRLDEPLEVKCNFYVMSERDSLYRFQAFIGTEVWYYNDSYYRPIPSLLVFSARAKQVAEMLGAGESGQLLATPTHQGGWIDPTVFAERLIEADANNREHDDHDRVLALLRLTVEGRMEALELLDQKLKKRNEYIDAVRYALGADINTVGRTPHFWITASRCRKPLSDDPAVESAHAGFGPDSGTAATYRFKTDHVLYSTGNVLLVDRFPSPAKQNIDLSLFPAVALHISDPACWVERVALYPWSFHVWPQNPSPAIATSIDVHARNIDKSYDYGFRHALTAIASQGTPFHPMAVTAIFLALATKSPLVHTAALDTAITVIADGRMTPDIAAKPIQELLSMNILTVKRWLKPLNIIAEESNRHAHFVRQVLENMVDSISQKEAGGFFEILHELGVSLNVQIKREECRHYLESFTGSGKAAKLAKKLLSE